MKNECRFLPGMTSSWPSFTPPFSCDLGDRLMVAQAPLKFHDKKKVSARAKTQVAKFYLLREKSLCLIHPSGKLNICQTSSKNQTNKHSTCIKHKVHLHKECIYLWCNFTKENQYISYI